MLRLGYGESVELVTKTICEEKRDKWLQRIDKMNRWNKYLTGRELRDIDKLRKLCDDKYNACIKSIGKPIRRK